MVSKLDKSGKGSGGKAAPVIQAYTDAELVQIERNAREEAQKKINAPLRTIDITWSAVEADRRADAAGRIMTRNGVPVDHKVAWDIYTKCTLQIQRLTAEILQIIPTFVGTPAGVHRAVFETMRLSPDTELPPGLIYTATQALSTQHVPLCGILRRLKPQSPEYEALRRIILLKRAKTTRNAAKPLLSKKQLAVLEAQGVSVPKPDDYYVDAGWLHAQHVAKTLNGRYAASHPNLHSLSKAMKKIFRLDGWVWILCDFDQLHIIIQGNQWGISRVCDVLESGADPHLNTAGAYMGWDAVSGRPGFKHWWTKAEGGSEADKARQAGKVFNYTGAYGGQAKVLLATALKEIYESADPYVTGKLDGTPVMGWMTLKMFEKLILQRRKMEPEWAAHYAKEKALLLQQGYLESEGTKRRFLCPKKTIPDISNCTVLGMEADIAGYVTQEAAQKWPEWLRVQTHDSLGLLVPAEYADQCRIELETLMNVRFPGHRYPYTAGAKLSDTLVD